MQVLKDTCECEEVIEFYKCLSADWWSLHRFCWESCLELLEFSKLWILELMLIILVLLMLN